jgi:transposase
VHKESKEDESILRISMDAKDKVRMGEFSRGGSSRIITKGLDHDFYDETITPFGLFLPEFNKTYLYMNQTSTSSDFIIDCLEDFWKANKDKFPKVTKLLLNLDNGGENSSRRTQFMKRIVDFVENEKIEIELAYYPPYHSKYNPVERVWGVLEKHWNGTLLDSVSKVIGFAKSMTYNGISPIVTLVDKVYCTGVKLSKLEMEEVEKKIVRLIGLEKWSVCVPCLTL